MQVINIVMHIQTLQKHTHSYEHLVHIRPTNNANSHLFVFVLVLCTHVLYLISLVVKYNTK